MAIPKKVRDQILVEAKHRCTVCSEKCFEIHHIVEQSEGGSDELENLIVLCPNCHQHRYHRSGEFTKDQLRLYKQKLDEKAEVERRLLQNLEDLRSALPILSPKDAESQLKSELSETIKLLSPDETPAAYASIQQTSEWLAERELARGGARRAIEIEWEVWKEQERAKRPAINIAKADESSFTKAPDFPAAYYFHLILDKEPYADWVEVFRNEHQTSFYSMKRKTYLDGDRVVMIVADSDNLQGHVDYAKRLVADTNQRIRGRGFQIIEGQGEQHKRLALQQFDAIQTMKSKVRDLKL